VSLESFYFGEGIVNRPFNDVRARQAVSMAIDRDALLAASYAGKGEWQTVFPPKFNPWWLDPRGKEFGPNAKYFTKNIAEAKQLLSAAGYANGLSVDLNVTFDYGAPAKERYELVAAMLKEAGINATLKSKEYAAYQATTSLGKFEGLAYGPYAVYPDPDGFLSTYWLSSSVRRKSKWEDPQLDQLIEKQSTLFDRDARKQVIWEIQRHAAEKAYAPSAVSGLIYAAHQPWIKNYYHSIDYGSPSNSVVEAWIDRG
jgi:ABC-type transport system substrate-binding protein